jgi:hypothetical protein
MLSILQVHGSMSVRDNVSGYFMCVGRLIYLYNTHGMNISIGLRVVASFKFHCSALAKMTYHLYN